MSETQIRSSPPGGELSWPVVKRQRLLIVSRDHVLVDRVRMHVQRGSDPSLFQVNDGASPLFNQLSSESFDVVIVDQHFVSEVTLAKLALALSPSTKLIAVGRFENLKSLSTILAAGVSACISREEIFLEPTLDVVFWGRLVDSILSRHLVMRAVQALGLQNSDLMMPAAVVKGSGIASSSGKVVCPDEQRLTARERELLILGSTGLQAAEIAGIAHLSRHTVNTHFKNIYRKLGVSRRSEAIQKARDLGQI